MATYRITCIVAIQIGLSGCGLNTPNKSDFRSEASHFASDGRTLVSEQSDYENRLVGHVECEIARALYTAEAHFTLPWLHEWGTAVTITITAIDQDGLSPGISLLSPMRNIVKSFPSGGPVNIPQYFALSLGATAAATSTRTETIQYTYLNADLINKGAQLPPDCAFLEPGVQIDGDLRIREFILDKALLAQRGNTSEYGVFSRNFDAQKFKHPDHPWEWPTFNTMTEEVQFLSAYGGSVTPTWKLASITADTVGNLAAAQKSYTNDLIITLGPVHPPTEKTAAALDGPAQNQHNARVNANAIATSVQSQMH